MYGYEFRDISQDDELLVKQRLVPIEQQHAKRVHSRRRRNLSSTPNSSRSNRSRQPTR